MAKDPKEWLRQADYDMDTAEYMLSGGRYFYAVFMCHLSIEKALKGLFQKRLREMPPKVHNLVFLIEKIGLKLPQDLYDWVFTLNRVSIPTRYPEDLQKMQKDYDEEHTREVVEKSKETLQWLRAQL
jgi:HEPN domain-containing protein